MPKVSDDYLRARRQQILSAAIECFARRGYNRTKMSDIAERAGVSYGVVYNYFRSKADILAAASVDDFADRPSRFEDAERLEDAGAALSQSLRVSLERWTRPESKDEVGLRTLLLYSAVRDSKFQALYEASYQDSLERYRALIRAGQHRGGLEPSLDDEALAQIFVALQEGLMALKVTTPSLDVEKFVTTLQALVDVGVRRHEVLESTRIQPPISQSSHTN